MHGLLYLLLLAMPIVGYVANSAFGASTPFFGLFDVPPIMGKHEQLSIALFAIHPYPSSSKWLHWLVALAVLTTAVIAIVMVNFVQPGPTHDSLYNFHAIGGSVP